MAGDREKYALQVLSAQVDISKFLVLSEQQSKIHKYSIYYDIKQREVSDPHI